MKKSGGKESLSNFARDCMDELSKSELEQQTKIVEWGEWSRGGYPTGDISDSSTPDITDDLALLVDTEVAKLRKKTKYIIQQIYVRGRGINELARITGLPKHRIMAYRDQGLNSIYDGLSEKC